MTFNNKVVVVVLLDSFYQRTKLRTAELNSRRDMARFQKSDVRTFYFDSLQICDPFC